MEALQSTHCPSSSEDLLPWHVILCVISHGPIVSCMLLLLLPVAMTLVDQRGQAGLKV